MLKGRIKSKLAATKRDKNKLICNILFMNEKMINWNDLQLFLLAAREGGLSGAARQAGRSPATIGRRIKALELAMGRQLFVRHDRGYTLTKQGHALFDEIGPLEPVVSRATKPCDTKPWPRVKISAGTWTTLVLIEAVDQLSGSPPDVQLCFVTGEDLLDIPRGEVAIGIRNQRPKETVLAARKVGEVAFAAYAKKDAPEHWIKVVSNTPSAKWLDRHIGDQAPYETNTPRNALDLAVAGHGVALLPTFIGDRQAKLERRSDPIAELAHDQWVVMHQDDRHLHPVRRVIDRLYAVFQG